MVWRWRDWRQGGQGGSYCYHLDKGSVYATVSRKRCHCSVAKYDRRQSFRVIKDTPFLLEQLAFQLLSHIFVNLFTEIIYSHIKV